MSNTAGRWAVRSLAGILLVALFSWWMSLAPSALPETAPPEAFSAHRAIRHIEATCQIPHPAGSKANDAVCAYIQEQLAAMGVETVLIDGPTGGRRGQSLVWARAVLGRVRGTAPTKAVAVDAHFDSVPYGPGAADDMSGIAAMLEAARALKAGPPLKNDVIFCFADQEEFGGDGARAFIEHPWFEEVGLVLGLETRGVKGPGLMFESTRENGWIIRELAKAGVSPRTNSIMTDFYRRMPFGSDFDQYKKRRPGFNVAYIDGFAYYHISLDSPENVCLDSLQHHGAYTLGVARHFGNLPLDGDLSAPDAAYFNLLGDWMAVYPLAWNRPLVLLATALFLAALVFGMAVRAVRFAGLLGGFMAAAGTLVLAMALWAPGAALAFSRFREMALYSNNAYCLAFALLAFAALTAAAATLCRALRPAEMVGGLMLLWTAALWGMHLYVPGGVYAPVWVVVFGALQVALLAWAGRGGRECAPGALAGAAALTVPSVLIIFPMIPIVGYALTAMGAFSVAGLLILVFFQHAPLLAAVDGRFRRWAPGALALAGLLVYGFAYYTNLPGPRTPKLNFLSYMANFDKGEAWWVSADQEPDEWTSQFFAPGTSRARIGEVMPGNEREYLKAPAPLDPLGPPRVEVSSDRVENGRRIIEGRFICPRDGQNVTVRALSATPVHAVSVAGMELGTGNPFSFHLRLMDKSGVALRLETDPGAPIVLEVRESSYGIPSFPEVKPRPDWMATEPNRVLDHRRPLHSEHTLTLCTIDLGTDEQDRQRLEADKQVGWDRVPAQDPDHHSVIL